MLACISFDRLFSSAFSDLRAKFSTSISCFYKRERKIPIDAFKQIQGSLPSQEDQICARWLHKAEARRCSDKTSASQVRSSCCAGRGFRDRLLFFRSLCLKTSKIK